MTTSWRRAGLLIAVLALDAGCAAHRAYRKGQSEAREGNWDLAVARLTKALAKSPENISYKIALESARVQASRFHYAEAKKQLAADALDKAVDELQVASNYDPSNKSASDDLAMVRERIRKREEQKQRLTDFDSMKVRAQAARVPFPVLSPRSPVPITLKFADQNLSKILESLGKLAGVNIIFDSDFRDTRKSIELTGVTFEEALNQITFTNRMFYKVVDQNTVIIVQESPAKRKAYDENLVQTFYLQNAEVNETLQLIKALAGIQKAAGNVSLGAITVMGTPDELAVARQIIDRNDKAKGEVMVEVQILEVNRDGLKRYGIEFANNTDYSASVTFSPTGAANEVSAGSTTVRAHLLSSLNLADFVVNIPSTLLTRFLQTEGNSRLLAAPRLRAAEGKKTSLKIGREVPVPVTTFQATQTGGQTFTPATSFQYRNVGVNLDLTPKISVSGDITLEIAAEFSLPGPPSTLAGQELPTFATRNLNGILRLRDGEASLIGGLIQGIDSASFRGVFGLQSVPILNKLFTSARKTVEDQEILISITPHIVRAPKLTEEDLAAVYIGTKENFRVPSARPSLFAETPEPQASTGAPTGTPAAPSRWPVPPAGPAPSAPASGQSAMPEAPPAPGPAAPAPTALASARAVFSPAKARVKPGEVVGVSLVLVGARGLTAVDVALSYDPTQLEAVDVAPGTLLTLDGSSVGAERRLEAGHVKVRFTRPTPATGSGAVAVFKFKGLAPGSSALGVDSLTLVSASGEEAATVPGTAAVVVEQ
jgi:general secretion pathway protein D